MEILAQQNTYNSNLRLGKYEGENISQVLFFEKGFALDQVTVRFAEAPVNPTHSTSFRIEARGTIGEDNFIDPFGKPLAISAWKNIADISPGEVAFAFNQEQIGMGSIAFSVVPNCRVGIPTRLAVFDGGIFNSYFMKYEFGTGMQRKDQALFIKIEGKWDESQVQYGPFELNEYNSLSIIDESE